MMAKTTQPTCWGPSLAHLCWVWPSSAPPITCGWNSTRMQRPLEKASNWSIPVSYYLVPVPCTRFRPPGLDLGNKETLFTQNKVYLSHKASSHCRRLTGRRRQVECYWGFFWSVETFQWQVIDDGFCIIRIRCAIYSHTGLNGRLNRMFSKMMMWMKLMYEYFSIYIG